MPQKRGKTGARRAAPASRQRRDPDTCTPFDCRERPGKSPAGQGNVTRRSKREEVALKTPARRFRATRPGRECIPAGNES